MKIPGQKVRIGAAVVIILATIAYLAVTAAQADKSYYVTIGELQAMGNKAYTRHLRVAGDVAANSIERSGTNARFVLTEQGHTLQVSYQGIEPPPDTFKDGSQALAMGTFGRDGVFHATELQAKCASKYAAAKPAPNTAAQTTCGNHAHQVEARPSLYTPMGWPRFLHSLTTFLAFSAASLLCARSPSALTPVAATFY
jgi:cytochrome c-type biogenesis protein CcmE